MLSFDYYIMVFKYVQRSIITHFLSSPMIFFKFLLKSYFKKYHIWASAAL